MRALQINDETWMLTSVVPIPMLGNLPVNGYVIKGAEPTLIDTGITPERDDFRVALKEIIDPADLKHIIITHADRDHTGALEQILVEAPNARVITNFITIGIMSIGIDPIPVERAFLVRDGSTVDLGDRTFTVARPPLFDNPSTLAFFDQKQKILFSADCFGALFGTPDGALVEDVNSLPEDEVAQGQLAWGSADTPWAHMVEDKVLGDRLAQFVKDKPEIVLGSHLPPMRGNVDRHVKTMSTLPSTEPLVPPDQAAMEAFMAEMAPH